MVDRDGHAAHTSRVACLQSSSDLGAIKGLEKGCYVSCETGKRVVSK